MNIDELRSQTDPAVFEASQRFYESLFATLTANHLMYDLGFCPKLIQDMNTRDYADFVRIVHETASILGH